MSFADYIIQHGHRWTTDVLILLVFLVLIIANWKRLIRFSVITWLVDHLMTKYN